MKLVVLMLYQVSELPTLRVDVLVPTRINRSLVTMILLFRGLLLLPYTLRSPGTCFCLREVLLPALASATCFVRE